MGEQGILQSAGIRTGWENGAVSSNLSQVRSIVREQPRAVHAGGFHIESYSRVGSKCLSSVTLGTGAASSLIRLRLSGNAEDLKAALRRSDPGF